MAIPHQRITVYETRNSNHHQEFQSYYQTWQWEPIPVIYEWIFAMRQLKVIAKSNAMISAQAARPITKQIVFDCR